MAARCSSFLRKLNDYQSGNNCDLQTENTFCKSDSYIKAFSILVVAKSSDLDRLRGEVREVACEEQHVARLHTKSETHE